MKNRLMHIIAAAALLLGSLSGAHAADSDNEKIHALLKNYEQALNASDVTGVVKLYTEDGCVSTTNPPR